MRNPQTQGQHDGSRTPPDPDLLLTVSIVTFEPDIAELDATLKSLTKALSALDKAAVAITITDNSAQDRLSVFLQSALKGWNYRLIHGQGKVGFGCGHNLAIARLGQFHLILNPDIEMEPDALQKALDFMQAHPSCALLSPHAVWPDGKRQYLCKRYPAAIDLLIRGFAPQAIRKHFKARLDRYEMQAETQADVFWNPPIVSGCFMFFRSSVLYDLGGFDPGYFLYFEDFDLSIRCGRHAAIAYVPQLRVVHAGGHASRKGGWHIRQFIRSARRFYATHGLKIL